MNKLTIIGNLTKDPQTRTVTTKDGAVSVCDFSVAVNGRKGEEPVYFRCTAWRGLGELIAKYTSKGRKVCVIGPVTIHTYTGNDGQQRAELSVQVDDFEFLSPRGEAEAQPKEAPKEQFTPVDINQEDLPF